MKRYEGLDPKLKQAVRDRDRHRCRWCGRGPDIGLDAHHIRYRRGYADDVEANLISLCRRCHDFVHTRIPKRVQQPILYYLTDHQPVTGLAVLRRYRQDPDVLEQIESGTFFVSRLDARRIANEASDTPQ